MKKRCMFFAAFCALGSVLGAQVFYEGQGGRNLGTISVSEIVPRGLSNDEAELLPLIQLTLSNDFNKYAGMIVPNIEDTVVGTKYTLTGTIAKTAGLYYFQFAVRDNSTGTTKTTYGPIQCTLEELRTLKAIKTASEALITGMGVTLTQAGKNALRTTATNEAEAMNALAKSLAAGATTFDKAYYTYEAQRLDPTLAEAARRLGAYQAELYKAPEISLAMPDIRIPEIKAPEFKAPEIRMAATGNIGADARKQQEQYNAQREVSRLRQESGNKAMKDLQDAFLAQFKLQSDTVKKRQADLLGQRDSLLAQQRTLLVRQRQMITQLRETENSYDAFFTEHPPFEIIYDPAAKPVGNANLEQGTIDLQFPITSVGTQAMQVIALMLADFEKGLGTITQGLKDINAEFDKIQSLLAQVEAAGGNALSQLMKDYAAQMAKVQAAENDYADQLARLDWALNTSGYAQLGRDYAVRPDAGYAERLAKDYAVQPAGYIAAGDRNPGNTWSLTKWNQDETRTFAIEARLENERGKTIGTAAVNLTNRIPAAEYTQPMSASALCVFHDVPVNDITDTLKVSIQRVNGRNVTIAANAGYIKISPLEADGYTKDGWDIGGYYKDGYNSYGYDKDGYYKDGYAKNGYDRDGYNRDGYGRDGYDENGYNRQGVTRKKIEKETKRAARQVRIRDMWGHTYIGLFIGGAVNIQPLGGLGELGFVAGGKWLVVDGGLGIGGGSLTVDDDYESAFVFSARAGLAFPFYFDNKVRFTIGGGIELLNIGGNEKDSTDEKGNEVKGRARILDTLFIPYAEARLCIAIDNLLRLFIGYRCGFPPEDEIETYFGKPFALRHTIFAGFGVHFPKK